MKVAIITFSPSGNTYDAGCLLKNELEKLGIKVDIYDITKSEQIFEENDYAAFLNESISEHDVLCVGAPVYENHFQENMIKLIKALPEPEGKWGKYALPFVTYGYISAGISLEDAGDLLKKSGRTVISGFKISAKHTMLDVLLERQIGTPSKKEVIGKVISLTAERIKAIESIQTTQIIPDQSKFLKYQSLKKRFLNKTLMNQRLRFFDLLPKPKVDSEKCRACGLCIKKCPVNVLEFDDTGKLTFKDKSKCIHCFNCMECCPERAIKPDKSKKAIEIFVSLVTNAGFEKPADAIYPREYLL